MKTNDLGRALGVVFVCDRQGRMWGVAATFEMKHYIL
jgi:hypothetical protein